MFLGNVTFEMETSRAKEIRYLRSVRAFQHVCGNLEEASNARLNVYVHIDFHNRVVVFRRIYTVLERGNRDLEEKSSAHRSRSSSHNKSSRLHGDVNCQKLRSRP